MCRITSPAALICGVTSSATPEKNGVSVTLRLVLAAVPVTVLLLTSVTKNSSVPALITAFWLFSVATLNNQKAVIKAGTDEFFVTDVSSNTVTGTAASTSRNVTLTPFFSGVALDVTPQISATGE